jgi:hypothetical protein
MGWIIAAAEAFALLYMVLVPHWDYEDDEDD